MKTVDYKKKYEEYMNNEEVNDHMANRNMLIELFGTPEEKIYVDAVNREHKKNSEITEKQFKVLHFITKDYYQDLVRKAFIDKKE